VSSTKVNTKQVFLSLRFVVCIFFIPLVLPLSTCCPAGVQEEADRRAAAGRAAAEAAAAGASVPGVAAAAAAGAAAAAAGQEAAVPLQRPGARQQ